MKDPLCRYSRLYNLCFTVWKKIEHVSFVSSRDLKIKDSQMPCNPVPLILNSYVSFTINVEAHSIVCSVCELLIEHAMMAKTICFHAPAF